MHSKDAVSDRRRARLNTARALVIVTGLLGVACGDDEGVETGTTDGMTGAAEATGASADTTSADASTTDEGTSTTGTTGTTEEPTTGSIDTDTDAWPEGPALYPADRALSPVTPYVADNLRSIAAQTPMAENVFAKVGASSTVSPHFMRCFDGEDIDFDGHDARAQLWETIDYFSSEILLDGETSFGRETLAAEVGWPAFKVLQGEPSPLQQEVDAISPRYAVVHYGTNDIGWQNLHGFGGDMLTIVDTLVDQGVIPLLTTILARGDNPEADAVVPRYNAVIRAVAQARQIPLIDLYLETAGLPGQGLAGDGLHPSVYAPEGVPKSCVFTEDGLAAGHSIRNLITLQTLDRMRQVVALEVDALDPTQAGLSGEGSLDDPFVIEEFPFSDLRDTASEGFGELDQYTGCDADQDESGREFLYRVELSAPATLWAAVFDRGGVDIDIHLLDESASEAGCIARDDLAIEEALDPGVYYLALDTFVSGDGANAGEYFVVVDVSPEDG